MMARGVHTKKHEAVEKLKTTVLAQLCLIECWLIDKF